MQRGEAYRGLRRSLRCAAFATALALSSATGATITEPQAGSSTRPPGIDYDIVYVRAPRYGDDVNTRWPDVAIPVQMEPGSDLMLLHPDGSEELLVAGGDGGIIDPYVSFDGQWVFYVKLHNLQKQMLNVQRRRVPKLGSDIYKIHLRSREIVRLTHQEWTPNTGAANWSGQPLGSGRVYTSLGYGIFNLGPCPLPGGRVIFTSSRNGFLPTRDFTFPNLQLFVMDDDGKNVEMIGNLNLGSALHPTVLADGRVMFSSYETQGVRDERVWALWAIWPDGRKWQPLVSAFESGAAFHFQTQLSDRRIIVEEYYNLNDNGFGSFVAIPPAPPPGGAPFGAPDPAHPSNPRFRQGTFGNGKPMWESYAFSPIGLQAVTAFTHGKDRAPPRDADGSFAGKVTHPAAAPHNDLLLVWTPGPANNLQRPTNRPFYDGGIYLLPGGRTAETYRDLVLIKNDPRYNEMQPRPVVMYRDIYGIDEPAQLEWLPNDGHLHRELPEGTPFGLVGTSSFYKRNTSPGFGPKEFDGLDPFNTRENEISPNWILQGADAGKYSNEDIYAVRLLALEPTSHFSYGPYEGRNFFNHAKERMRILGEIPLRKVDIRGNPILDPDGNPDTSFLAKIPADVPFTFQTLDRNGMVLNMAQTWHQLRPGEVRNDCGGCHAHAQVGTDFARTYAARPDYEVPDLTTGTPLLMWDESKNPKARWSASGAVDVEYYRDIKPIFERSCVACHSMKGNAAAGLVLDDDRMVGGYENTYNRLANDPAAKYGPKPLIGTWRQTNASRYIRKFQARRSLLIWKVFGRRLDGWRNEDHPTEAVPGDPSTFPKGANPNRADIDFVGTIMPPPHSDVPKLTGDEKMTIARWIDLGCPINRNERGRRERGWFLDDLRPTLTLTLPRAGDNELLSRILIGMYDYYSGLDEKTFRVVADFDVDGIRAGKDLASGFERRALGIWELRLEHPIQTLPRGVLTVSVKDRQGNLARLERTFSVGEHNQAARRQTHLSSR